MLGIILRRVKSIQCDGLIADHAGRFIDSGRVHASCVHAARDKESAGLMQLVESAPIQIATIHDIKSTGLDGHYIEHIHIGHFAVADVNKRRNSAATCAS